MSLKLNSSGGGSVTLDAPVTASNYTITVPASSGTVATLASVTNNGVVYINSSGQATSGSALTFDSSGNLGLGVTPSAWSLPAFESTYGLIGGVSEINITQNAYYNAGWKYKATAVSAKYSQFAGNHAWYTAPSGTAGNAISFTQAMTLENTAASNTQLTIAQTTSSTVFQSNGQDFYLNMRGTGSTIFRNGSGDIERMRIDSSGRVTLGSGAENFGRLNLNNVFGSLSGNVMVWLNSNNATSKYLSFEYNGNGGSGSITPNGSSNVAYNTSSDYRLKENIQPMQGALAVVKQLNPVTWNWKIDGSDGQGFIAHELQAVVPDCVTGEKDAVDAEGNPVYQGVDTSFLVATLTKAIQEQQEQINQLRAEVAALKGA